MRLREFGLYTPDLRLSLLKNVFTLFTLFTFVAHCSLLTAHRSPLIAHCSPLTAHCSSLTAHSSSLTAHSSSLIAHSSLLIAHCSSLTARMGAIMGSPKISDFWGELKPKSPQLLRSSGSCDLSAESESALSYRTAHLNYNLVSVCIVYLAGDSIAAWAMASAIAFMTVHSARVQRPFLGR